MLTPSCCRRAGFGFIAGRARFIIICSIEPVHADDVEVDASCVTCTRTSHDSRSLHVTCTKSVFSALCTAGKLRLRAVQPVVEYGKTPSECFGKWRNQLTNRTPTRVSSKRPGTSTARVFMGPPLDTFRSPLPPATHTIPPPKSLNIGQV